MTTSVYLDHNATTPVDPIVLEAMLPWLSSGFGNASSRHAAGRAARQAIDEARGRVAEALGAHASEVIFTSGGSEANNLIIKGALAGQPPALLAVSAVEHPCVTQPAEQLKRRGWRMQRLAVDSAGRIDRPTYDRVVQQRPALVSVMLANNETGVLQDAETLAAPVRQKGGIFHTDAVQAVGRVAVDFRRLNAAGVDALTLSGHKIGGPQGVGALIVDKRLEIEPLIAGGGQERGLRSGTENVAAIVGLGAACALLPRRLVAQGVRQEELRRRLENGLQALGAAVFGGGAARVPNTSCFAFAGLDGDALVGRLDRQGFAVASGAACSSADPGPSHVLLAMGVDDELARGAVRVSLGPENDSVQIDAFLVALRGCVHELRQLTAMAV